MSLRAAGTLLLAVRTFLGLRLRKGARLPGSGSLSLVEFVRAADDFPPRARTRCSGVGEPFERLTTRFTPAGPSMEALHRP